MGSDPASADFAVEMMAGAGEVSARRMFGEFGVYLDGKFIGVICDDMLYFKDTPGGRAAFPEAEILPPFPKANPYLLAAPLLDDPERLCAVARAVWDDLPAPKPKTPRKKTT